MIDKMREDAFSILLAIVAVVSATFVLTLMAIMVENMNGIL